MESKILKYFLFFLSVLTIFPATAMAAGVDEFKGRADGDVTNFAYIDGNNDLYMTGENTGVILGAPTGEVNKPVLVMNDVVKVDVDNGSVAVIKEDGTLWTWGKNIFGNCATGKPGTSNEEAAFFTPLKIADNVMDVQLTSNGGGYLKNDRSLWVWGNNEAYGLFGNGSTESSYTPVHIKDNVKDFAVGFYNTAYINEANELYICGKNENGMLGTGSEDYTLVQREFKKILDDAKQVSLGVSVNGAVKNNGEFDVWGRNTSGALGLDSKDSQLVKSSPTKILDNITEVSIDSSGVGAVSGNGEFYSWGWLSTVTGYKPFIANKGFKAAYVQTDEYYRTVIDENGGIWFYGKTFNGTAGQGVSEKNCLTIFNSGFSVKPQTKVEASSIRFPQSEIRLKIGEKRSLLIIPDPSSADITGLTWENSNPTAVDVKDGMAEAKAKGESNITATTKNGKKATVKVVVDDAGTEVSKVTFKKGIITLRTGQSYKMKTTLEPETASDKTLAWKSSKDDVARASDGTITAGKEGTAVIEAVSPSGAKAECTVMVHSSASTPAVIPESGKTVIPTASSNINAQNYAVHANVISSYLAKGSNGYMRVEDLGKNYSNRPKKIAVSYFNNDYQCTGEKELEYELPRFGGFYNGDNFYYMVFGQDNPQESNYTEVVRIVKYDKNWNRIDSLSLYGMNTKYPFSGGALRFVQSGDNLYVRTCHTMYKNPKDGKNHQSNMTIQLNEPDMDLIEAHFVVSSTVRGYVSHSFNQFIITDGARLAALDHGDAYGRAAEVGVYMDGVNKDGFTKGLYKIEQAKTFPGETGDNYTGASLGGFEASSSNYLVAGNSVDQGNFASSKTRNIFLTVSPKNQFVDVFGEDNIDTKGVEITSRSEGAVSASTPHLIKFNDNRFCIVWANMPDVNWNTNTDGTISYVFVDGNGNVISPEKTVSGFLSDCAPVVNGNAAQWYVTDGKNNTLYTLSSDGNLTQKSTGWSSDDSQTPTTPSNPNQPETPSQPSGPDSTGNPLQPSVPTQPNSPTQPFDQNPPVTDNPETPGDPTIPGNPLPKPDEPDASETVDNVPIYRLYNRVSMEHLYTTDQNEVAELTKDGSDWNNEGTGWVAPSSGVPAYRLYNPVLHQHLYTTDQNEVNVLTTQDIWQKDFNGLPLFYSGGDKPIYRLYQPADGQHLLTTDENEYNTIPGLWGWRQEGVALKGLS